MLTKDLLRVSRAGGGYRLRFADEEHEALAARLIGIFQGHVGEPKGDLDDAIEAVEREAEDFKLVRGLAKLLEREATFETRAPLDPERAREAAFEAAEAVGVATPEERSAALSRAAEAAGASPDAIDASLYADLEERQVLSELDVRWGPAALIAQYNLSLAQTALFDATEVRVTSSDPKALMSAVKRLRLMYEIRKIDAGREVVVTGPDALFRRTRRYGTRFARLLRTVARAREWRLEATIDDRGSDHRLELTDADPVRTPDVEPVTSVSYDSDVEADFATRFESLDLDWSLTREPAPLEAGDSVMIPDFAFDYEFADVRVFFEIMGFWTPEYVEKKLEKLEDLEDVEMIVAVDESLGAGEAIEARDHRVVRYSGSVGVKAVRDALRAYEDEIVANHAAALPDELVPEGDVVSIEELAAEHGVSETAIEGKRFPEHERVGRTLVRPAVLSEIDDGLEPGLSLEAAESVLAERGISESSAALSTLGYVVEWEGLGGGVLRRRGD